MRPATFGENDWHLMENVAMRVDMDRHRFDAIMRGFTNNKITISLFEGWNINLEALQSSPEETTIHILKRVILQKIIYYANSFCASMLKPITQEPHHDPSFRHCALDYVNVMRSIRKLQPIGNFNNDFRDPCFLRKNEVNKNITYNVPGSTSSKPETYNITHCRPTTIQLMDGKIVEASPEFYDSRYESWFHRAVYFSEYLASNRKEQTEDDGFYLTVNKCKNCNACFLNVEDIPCKDVSLTPTNTSHRKTSAEFADQILFAKTSTQPCRQCRMDYTCVEYARYHQSTRMRYFYEDLIKFMPARGKANSSPGQGTFDAQTVQEISNYLNFIISNAVNVAISGEGLSTGAKIKKTRASHAQASSSDTTANTGDDDENAIKIVLKCLYTAYNQEFILNQCQSILTDKDARESFDLEKVYPTCLVLKSFASDPSIKDLFSSGPFLRAVGSILFPPHPFKSNSYMYHIYMLKNMVNVRQGKPIPAWKDILLKKKAFGSNCTSPETFWPYIIGQAVSLCDNNAKVSFMNAMDKEDKQNYDKLYTIMILEYSVTQSQFNEKFQHPHLRKMFDIAKKTRPDDYPGEFEKYLNAMKFLEFKEVIGEDEVKRKAGFESVVVWNQCLYGMMRNNKMRDFALMISKRMGHDGTDSTSPITSETSEAENGQVPVKMNVFSSEDVFWNKIMTHMMRYNSLMAILEAESIFCYLNMSCRSLVSFFWPVPNEYILNPSDFLMKAYWKWHCFQQTISEFVRAILMDDVPFNNFDSFMGNDTNISMSFAVITGMNQRAAMYAEFLQKYSSSYSNLSNVESFEMSQEWTSRFWTIWTTKMDIIPW